MTSKNEDLPTILASIMVAFPRIALGSGVAYLRMKRKARRGAKAIYKELIVSGAPEKVARKLSESYETEISIRRLASNFGMPSQWVRPDWNTGK
jgi:hypothetical protein